MNSFISRFTVIMLSIMFILFMITANNIVIESVSFSISIWKDNLFPTLFPFFVVSNILLEYGFVDIIGNILSIPMKKIFKLPGCSGFVLAASLFSGFPSGAKYTTSLVKNNKINRFQAEKLLTFTHYSNPLFILGFIGSILNKKTAYIILVSHILGGLLVGKIFSFNINKDLIKKEDKLKKEHYLPIGKALQKAIMDSLNTMFLLLGIVTIFIIITSIIKDIFNLPLLYSTIISGILEMTQGIKSISMLDINNYIKTIMTAGIISFGGLSVHMQVLSIISDENIKYKSFFLARIIHSLLSIGLASILYFIL